MSDRSKIEWCDATWNPIRAKNRATGKVGWFCVHASDGCRNCYAEGINRRLGTGVDYKAQNEAKVLVYVDDKVLREPLRWRKPRVVFPCSMTDLFGSFVTDEMIDRVFAIMALCPQHVFIVLTKRSDRMRAWFEERWQGTPAHRFADGFLIPPGGETGRRNQVEGAAAELTGGYLAKVNPCDWAWPLPNVWLGVSCEDQANADARIPDLIKTPAAVRFVSAEPLLGPVEFRPYTLTERPCIACAVADKIGEPRESKSHPINCGWRHDGERAGTYLQVEPNGSGIDWVIAGGESGRDARPMHPDWARQLRDQCAAAGVAFFFKQWGEWAPGEVVPPSDNPIMRGSLVGAGGQTWTRVGKAEAGRLLDGRTHDERPPLNKEASP